MEETLRKLMDAHATSGQEENVADVLKNLLKGFVNDVRTDRIGNIIFRKGSGKPKIMIAAHMDEIGMIVKYIDDKGFIRFDSVGGVDKKTLLGQRVVVHTRKGPVNGVIGLRPIHVQEKEEQGKVTKIKDMYIDIGAKNKDDALRMGVSVGAFITFRRDMVTLGKNRIVGNAFDDRVGCLVMVEVMRRLKEFEGSLYAVGTVKEEIGLIGIRGSAFGIDPDIAIALDVTIAGDTPDMKEGEVLPKIGEGPVLLIKDAVNVLQPNLRKWVEDVAKRNNIPLQYDIMGGGATDASILPTVKEGIPSIAVLVPSRYIHSPSEVVDMKDVDRTVKLVVELVKDAHNVFG